MFENVAYSVLVVTPTTEDWIPDYIGPANALVTQYGGKYLARTSNLVMKALTGARTAPRSLAALEFKMHKHVDEPGFQPINQGYNTLFHPNRLSLGLVVPLESYATGPVPTMTRHVDRVLLAEELGFSAIWLREVPFNVPSFGDAGQMLDPLVYLGLLAGQTDRITL